MSNAHSLATAASEVKDRAGFVAFVRLLANDKLTEDRIAAETPAPP